MTMNNQTEALKVAREAQNKWIAEGEPSTESSFVQGYLAALSATAAPVQQEPFTWYVEIPFDNGGSTFGYFKDEHTARAKAAASAKQTGTVPTIIPLYTAPSAQAASQQEVKEPWQVLQNLVDCISETRGKDATEALATARALLENRPAALLGTQAHRQEIERDKALEKAALVCERQQEIYPGAQAIAFSCAAAIRALKGQPSAPAEPVAFDDLHASPIYGLSWADVDRLAESCTSDALGINARAFAGKVAALCRPVAAPVVPDTAIPELRNIQAAKMTSDFTVELRFPSCRSASAFKIALDTAISAAKNPDDKRGSEG